MSALRNSLREVELVDRDVDLGGRRIDLVGVDRAGKLWLLLWVAAGAADPEGEQALLTALDATVWFAEHSGALAQHLDRARLRPELGLALALVGETFPARLVGRAAALDPAVVQLFELRRLRTGRGDHAYLARIDLTRPRGRSEAAVTPDEFLAGVPEQKRELATRLMTRMARIDGALEAHATRTGMTWLFGAGAVCAVELSEGGLVARTLPGGEPRRLEDLGDLDAFLAAVLDGYLQQLSEASAGPEAASADGGGGREVPAAVALAEWGGPILTPEELAEFRNAGA